MAVSEKIQRASAATVAIDGHVFNAKRAVAGFDGRIVNGWLVYDDVSSRLREVNEAISELEKARDLLHETAWPTTAEYEAEGG